MGIFAYIHYPLRGSLFAGSNCSAHRRIIVTFSDAYDAVTVCGGMGENQIPRIIVTFSDAYDAITVCGGMGENQIPCSALHEMIRLVKPGRLLFHMY